jgi:nitrile hydratase subunit alpha
VCTLCSCYPYELLGNPPWWYKSDEYREPIIKNPRQLLSQMFKLQIPENIEIRVHDSTSDIRYMVLPKRPSGTEALKEEDLSKLITEESLIGVGELKKPSAVASALSA